MEDRLDALGGQKSCHRSAVAVAADVQSSALRDGRAVARGEVVEHHDVVPGRQERLSRDRADIPGATGHEDLRHAPNHTVRRRTASPGAGVAGGPDAAR